VPAVPAAQVEGQVVAPVVVLVEHVPQDEAPVEAWYLPEAQLVQDVAPAAPLDEYCPAAHGVHEVRPY